MNFKIGDNVLVYDCPLVEIGQVSEITQEGFIRVKTHRQNRIYSKFQIYHDNARGRLLLHCQLHDDADTLIRIAKSL